MDGKELSALIVAPLSVAAVSWLWQDELALAGTLALLGLVLFMSGADRDELLLFLFGGVAGPVSESVAIFFGAWKYPVASLMNVPVWLPILWAIASVFINRIHRMIAERLGK